MRLAPIEAEETRKALGYSGVLLMLLCIALILPSSPRAIAWVQLFWPEQLVLLGGLGWLLWGEKFAWALVLLLGVLARLVYVSRWLLVRWRRPAPAAATGSGGTSPS